LIDVADIEIIKSSDLILLLNEHDFININHFFNQNKICEFKKTAKTDIICFRENPAKSIWQANVIQNDFIYVKSLTQNSKTIPKIFINGRWFNCGPEWINPILFQPKMFNNQFVPQVTEIRTGVAKNFPNLYKKLLNLKKCFLNLGQKNTCYFHTPKYPKSDVFSFRNFE
jgi:hypothetical protein